jgi:hypothetical protein
VHRLAFIGVNRGGSPRAHRKGLSVSVAVETYLDRKHADRCYLCGTRYLPAWCQLTASRRRYDSIHTTFEHSTRMRIEHQFHLVSGSDIRELILREGGNHRNARCIDESSGSGGRHGHEHGAFLHLPIYDVAIIWCRHFTLSQIETCFVELGCNAWNITLCYLPSAISLLKVDEAKQKAREQEAALQQAQAGVVQAEAADQQAVAGLAEARSGVLQADATMKQAAAALPTFWRLMAIASSVLAKS